VRKILMELEATIVIPVHNEEAILRANTEKLRDYLREKLPNHEIILCENGSVDRTPEIAQRLAEEFDDVEFLRFPEPNLAEAVKSGFHAARGEKVIYFPIDLSVDLGFIPESVRLLSVFDAVVGSKRLSSELDRRPLVRRVTSRGFHGMVRGLFGVEFTDTTCVKAFKRSKVLPLMERIPTSSRVFETELLVEADREGFDIVEVPVVVEEHRRSREVLWYKIRRKLEDLLSARLDRIFLLVGVPTFLVGFVTMLFLILGKLRSATASGFVNPYTFLLSMLMVISGFQFVTFGLLTNLIMQIRRQVAQAIEDRD
jgi:glycosyltransferase involved in cell wall biosynthesis